MTPRLKEEDIRSVSIKSGGYAKRHLAEYHGGEWMVLCNGDWFESEEVYDIRPASNQVTLCRRCRPRRSA